MVSKAQQTETAIAPVDVPSIAAPVSDAAKQITAYRQFATNFVAKESPSTFLGLGACSFALLGLTEFALPLLETIAIGIFAVGGAASLGVAAYKWRRTQSDMTGHDRT